MPIARWPLGTTLSEAIHSVLAQKARPTGKPLAFEAAAKEIGTTLSTFSRWASETVGQVPYGSAVDDLAAWLGTDLVGIGALIAATLRGREKWSPSARR